MIIICSMDELAFEHAGGKDAVSGVGLNLLVALDALLTERNLTAAARSVNLSQPAMSAALARLRRYFRDEIFTLQGRRMVPTAFGEALAAPTRDALLRIKMTLGTRHAFEPSISERRFRVVVSDFMTIIFFSQVIDRVRQIAPHVTFELLPFDDQPDELLRRGELDFLVFPEIYLSDAYPCAPLFEEHLVCVACASNNDIGEAISFSQYMASGHVAAQFGRSRRPAIEEWLMLEHGLKRRIEVAVQSFAMIPHMIVGTNRIATMHSRLAQHYSRTLPLRVLPLPLPLPGFVEALQWPALHHQDPGSLWLRNLIHQEAKQFAL